MGQSPTLDSRRFAILRRHPKLFSLAITVVAITLWWLFRPERLFLNQQVSEAAPTDIATIQPLFTGSLLATAGSPETTGRVSIRKAGNTLQVEVSNLQSKAGNSFMVALASAAAGSNQRPKILGTITPGGHEKLAIPDGIEVTQDRVVLLLDDSERTLAKATLEVF